MENLIKILTWASNIITLLILGLVAYFVGAHLVEGFASDTVLTKKEIMLSVTMGLMFLGAIMGLRWRLVGGLTTVVTYIGFALIQNNFMQGMVFYVFLLTGIFNLILFAINRKRQ